LLPAGELLGAVTPILGVTAGVCFAMAAAALLGWSVPSQWFAPLIVVGAVASIAVQVVWISPWAVLPLLLDAALLWAVFGMRLTVDALRG